MDLAGVVYPGETNFNTAPRQTSFVIRENQDGGIAPLKAQWWLIPSWAKEKSSKYSMFNARCENLKKSAAFRRPFQSQRCIVPVTGFYEWVNLDGEKQPYYVHAPEHSGLLLAGLWDCWLDKDNDNQLFTFTIVTTQVSSSLEFLHRRQPVMLDKPRAMKWLDSASSVEELNEMFEPRLPYDMSATPVSTYVNNVRNHGEACLERVGETIPLAA